MIRLGLAVRSRRAIHGDVDGGGAVAVDAVAGDEDVAVLDDDRRRHVVARRHCRAHRQVEQRTLEHGLQRDHFIRNIISSLRLGY